MRSSPGGGLHGSLLFPDGSPAAMVEGRSSGGGGGGSHTNSFRDDDDIAAAVNASQLLNTTGETAATGGAAMGATDFRSSSPTNPFVAFAQAAASLPAEADDGGTMSSGGGSRGRLDDAVRRRTLDGADHARRTSVGSEAEGAAALLAASSRAAALAGAALGSAVGLAAATVSDNEESAAPLATGADAAVAGHPRLRSRRRQSLAADATEVGVSATHASALAPAVAAAAGAGGASPRRRPQQQPGQGQSASVAALTNYRTASSLLSLGSPVRHSAFPAAEPASGVSFPPGSAGGGAGDRGFSVSASPAGAAAGRLSKPPLLRPPLDALPPAVNLFSVAPPRPGLPSRQLPPPAGGAVRLPQCGSPHAAGAAAASGFDIDAPPPPQQLPGPPTTPTAMLARVRNRPADAAADDISPLATPPPSRRAAGAVVGGRALRSGGPAADGVDGGGVAVSPILPHAAGRTSALVGGTGGPAQSPLLSPLLYASPDTAAGLLAPTSAAPLVTGGEATDELLPESAQRRNQRRGLAAEGGVAGDAGVSAVAASAPLRQSPSLFCDEGDAEPADATAASGPAGPPDDAVSAEPPAAAIGGVDARASSRRVPSSSSARKARAAIEAAAGVV